MTGPIKNSILKVFGKEPETLDELAECVIAVINSQPNGKSKKYHVVGFAWVLCHSPSISNTHSSPEGYPQNFRQISELPKGYPGWGGRVWIRYQDAPDSFGCSPFKMTLSNTGTGGGGSYGGPWTEIEAVRYQKLGNLSRSEKHYPRINCYSWDYRIYDLDWPLIKKWADEMTFLGNLKGQPWINTHKFNWTDPEILEADARFIADATNYGLG